MSRNTPQHTISPHQDKSLSVALLKAGNELLKRRAKEHQDKADALEYENDAQKAEMAGLKRKVAELQRSSKQNVLDLTDATSKSNSTRLSLIKVRAPAVPDCLAQCPPSANDECRALLPGRTCTMIERSLCKQFTPTPFV